MKEKVDIICAGMLDTKGDEIRFLAECAKADGANPILMDLSLGHEVEWADISLRQVLATTGHRPEDVFSLSRVDAIEIVANSGAAKIRELHAQGQVDGIISWAGSIGTTVATHVMRALPLGVPKVMLSTATIGDVSRFTGLSDIYLSHPISEKGINRLTRIIAGNGVAAVTGMAKAALSRAHTPASPQKVTKGLSAVTLYGVTTQTAIRCANRMEQAGWDMLHFHQTGIGAAMEDLIRQGQIGCVFDLSPGEITNNFFRSRSRNPDIWKGERFTAAFDMGIPAVIAPGGIDMSPFGTWEALPERYKQQFENGQRKSYQNSGKPFYHSASTLIIPTTLSENLVFSDYMVTRFNKSTGPSLFLVPMKGWSNYDQSAARASKENGWPERSDGPTWIADPKYPQWSARARALWGVLQDKLNRNNVHIDALLCDLHFGDPEFAELAYTAMADMLAGNWRPGLYRDYPYVRLNFPD